MTLYSDMLQISLDGWAACRAARSAAVAASRAARAAARSNAPCASRAARSAASRAARSAAAAASRAARSAAANAAEAARGASIIRQCDFPNEEEERRRIRTGTVPPPRELVPGVDVTAKDMESDEATWALYEQWCNAYSKVRDRAEMQHRFHVFKSAAASVLSHNEACEGRHEDSICLGHYADGYSAQDVAEVKRIAAESGSPYLVSLTDSIAVDVFPSDQDQSPAAQES